MMVAYSVGPTRAIQRSALRPTPSAASSHTARSRVQRPEVVALRPEAPPPLAARLAVTRHAEVLKLRLGQRIGRSRSAREMMLAVAYRDNANRELERRRLLGARRLSP